MRRLRMGLTLVVTACLGIGCGGGTTGPSGPIVASVNGATAPAGPIGSTVVIQGSNLGATQGTGQVLFANGSGGTVAAVIASASDWTNTLIVTSVPSGAATGNLVVNTVGGTSTPLTFTVSQKVAFSPSTISWTATTALPVGLSGHAVGAATYPGTTTKSFVYVAGGADSTNAPRSNVLVASVTATGTLGAWTPTTALPAPVAFAAAVAATPANSPVSGAGYLYMLGGDSTASGKPVATVYRGTLDATGAVTGWTPTTALPAAVHSLGAVIFNGNVYVAGGSASGNAPVATVYRAPIQASGSLGSWQPLTSLPLRLSYFAFALNGTFLYAFGGDSGTVTPNDSSLTATAVDNTAYAEIDVRTGDLTAAGWSSSGGQIGKLRAKHTAVVAGGDVLITAGLYNGSSSGSAEERYAPLNADGSVSSFSGATGSNTIFSAGGGNVFNHAAVGYVDGTGAFHVLVIGGDDVDTPTKKHNTVFFY